MLRCLNAYADSVSRRGRAEPQVFKAKYLSGLLGCYVAVVRAALTPAITYIIKLRTEYKVLRVNARGRVATVHDHGIFGYRPFKEIVRNAVCELFGRSTARAYQAVPHVVLVRAPKPTIVGSASLEFFFKSVTQGLHTLIMGKQPTTVNPSLAGG